MRGRGAGTGAIRQVIPRRIPDEGDIGDVLILGASQFHARWRAFLIVVFVNSHNLPDGLFMLQCG